MAEETQSITTRHDAEIDAMMAALSKHSVRLTPLIKRRVFPDLPGVPRGVALGWAQLTSGEGATISIGLFIGHDRFSQIALADGNGRVFVPKESILVMIPFTSSSICRPLPYK